MDSDSLADELGIELSYAPEDMAPPVDGQQLRAFIRGKLEGDVLEETCHLIATFRSWHTGWREVLRQDE